MRRIIIFIGIVNCTSAVYAQGEIDLQPRVFYRNEWSIAVMLNSNGFGANYRYGQRIDAAKKRLFEVDFAYMKDPKEQRTYGLTNSGARFVDGKKNLAFDFRFGYGKQNEIYRKHDVGGVAIRYFYNFGPSVLLLKPIYYEIGESMGMSQPLKELPAEKYNSNWHDNNKYVISRASFFKGFDELRPIPGAFAKFGVNFEFGKQDRIIHALEAGLIAEGFIKKVEIMDFSNPDINNLPKYAKNRQFFLTLFVSYRFGRIVDPFEVRKKRERSREISY